MVKQSRTRGCLAEQRSITEDGCKDWRQQGCCLDHHWQCNFQAGLGFPELPSLDPGGSLKLLDLSHARPDVIVLRWGLPPGAA